jgi:transposase
VAALPVDFPPWEAVYAFFERWNGRGMPLELVRRLRELLRAHQGRAAQPTACIVDSQMIKAHDTVSKKTSGYHGGKKITGRGRHLAVDTEGWLLALVVTAASVSDKAGAKILLIRLFDAFSTLKIMWADSGYDGRPLARYALAVAAITVEVVARTSPHSFQVLRRRWVVERTFGWLMRYRRLARDYERTTANSEAMIYWATLIIMTRRLARYENGQPPLKRWGAERPRPTEQTALSTGSKAASRHGQRRLGRPSSSSTRCRTMVRSILPVGPRPISSTNTTSRGAL